MDRSAALRDERLWARVDEIVRRLHRLETLAHETRGKVALLEKHLGVHLRDDLDLIEPQKQEPMGYADVAEDIVGKEVRDGD